MALVEEAVRVPDVDGRLGGKRAATTGELESFLEKVAPPRPRLRYAAGMTRWLGLLLGVLSCTLAGTTSRRRGRNVAHSLGSAARAPPARPRRGRSAGARTRRRASRSSTVSWRKASSATGEMLHLGETSRTTSPPAWGRRPSLARAGPGGRVGRGAVVPPAARSSARAPTERWASARPPGRPEACAEPCSCLMCPEFQSELVPEFDACDGSPVGTWRLTELPGEFTIEPDRGCRTVRAEPSRGLELRIDLRLGAFLASPSRAAPRPRAAFATALPGGTRWPRRGAGFPPAPSSGSGRSSRSSARKGTRCGSSRKKASSSSRAWSGSGDPLRARRGLPRRARTDVPRVALVWVPGRRRLRRGSGLLPDALRRALSPAPRRGSCRLVRSPRTRAPRAPSLPDLAPPPTPAHPLRRPAVLDYPRTP